MIRRIARVLRPKFDHGSEERRTRTPAKSGYGLTDDCCTDWPTRWRRDEGAVLSTQMGLAVKAVVGAAQHHSPVVARLPSNEIGLHDVTSANPADCSRLTRVCQEPTQLGRSVRHVKRRRRSPSSRDSGSGTRWKKVRWPSARPRSDYPTRQTRWPGHPSRQAGAHPLDARVGLCRRRHRRGDKDHGKQDAHDDPTASGHVLDSGTRCLLSTQASVRWSSDVKPRAPTHGCMPSNRWGMNAPPPPSSLRSAGPG